MTLNDNACMQRFLTPEEVSVTIKISTGTLANWRSKTQLTGIPYGPPFIRIGGMNGRARYNEQELQEWLDKSISTQKLVDRLRVKRK